jgi:hypothetical protein
MEATAGIEPACADLQSAASPLRHVALSPSNGAVGSRCADAVLSSSTRARALAIHRSVRPFLVGAVGENSSPRGGGLARASDSPPTAKGRVRGSRLLHLKPASFTLTLSTAWGEGTPSRQTRLP